MEAGDEGEYRGICVEKVRASRGREGKGREGGGEEDRRGERRVESGEGRLGVGGDPCSGGCRGVEWNGMEWKW